MNETELKRHLQTVGMKAFVDYYLIFRDNDRGTCLRALEANTDWKPSGNAARVTSVKAIFNSHNEHRVLEIISKSARVDDVTRQKALNLLKQFR